MANWQHCPEVEQDAQRHGGRWVFKGTGVPLYVLHETLATGATVDDFAELFGVGVELAAAALRYEADELHDYRLDYPGPVPYARNPHTEDTDPDDAMWRNCSIVEQATGRLGGAWVFIDSRLPLWAMYSELAAGTTIDEFVDWYCGSKAKVVAVLEHEAKALRTEIPTAHAHTA